MSVSVSMLHRLLRLIEIICYICSTWYYDCRQSTLLFSHSVLPVSLSKKLHSRGLNCIADESLLLVSPVTTMVKDHWRLNTTPKGPWPLWVDMLPNCNPATTFRVVVYGHLLGKRQHWFPKMIHAWRKLFWMMVSSVVSSSIDWSQVLGDLACRQVQQGFTALISCLGQGKSDGWQSCCVCVRMEVVHSLWSWVIPKQLREGSMEPPIMEVSRSTAQWVLAVKEGLPVDIEVWERRENKVGKRSSEGSAWCYRYLSAVTRSHTLEANIYIFFL